MGTNLDYIVGIAKETTFGSAVAPARFFETEAKLDHARTRTFGKGLRPSVATDRVSRGKVTKDEVSGDFELDLTTKGFGYLLEAALGEPTNLGDIFTGLGEHSVLRFVPTTTDPLPSYTITELIPYIDGTIQQSGASPNFTSANVRRFTGCQVESLTIDVKNGQIVTMKVSWIGQRSYKQNAIPVASYPANDEIITAGETDIQFGTGLTDPEFWIRQIETPLVAHPGTQPLVTDFSLTIKNNLDSGGYGLGYQTYKKRRSMLGKRDITGSFTVERSGPEFETWYESDQAKAVTLSLGMGLGAGFGFGLSLPAVKLEGEVGKSNGGSPTTLTVPFKALDDGTTGFALEVLYEVEGTAP